MWLGFSIVSILTNLSSDSNPFNRSSCNRFVTFIHFLLAHLPLVAQVKGVSVLEVCLWGLMSKKKIDTMSLVCLQYKR